MNTNPIPEAREAAEKVCLRLYGASKEWQWQEYFVDCITQACLSYHKRQSQEQFSELKTQHALNIAEIRRQNNQEFEELQKQCEELRRENEALANQVALPLFTMRVVKERDSLRTRAEKAEAELAKLKGQS